MESAMWSTSPEIAPTFWPRPDRPDACARSAACSCTPSDSPEPVSTAGRSDGRSVLTQPSAATASSLSYGTSALTRPVRGRSTPGTSVNDAELPATFAPSAVSWAICAAPAGAAEWIWTPMRPPASRASTPADRERWWARSRPRPRAADRVAPISAARCRSSDGTLDWALVWALVWAAGAATAVVDAWSAGAAAPAGPANRAGTASSTPPTANGRLLRTGSLLRSLTKPDFTSNLSDRQGREPRYPGAPRSLVLQGLQRVELGRAPGREDRREHADHHCHRREDAQLQPRDREADPVQPGRQQQRQPEPENDPDRAADQRGDHALVPDHPFQLPPGQPDRAQHAELAGAFEHGQHQRVDDAEQADHHRQREQHVQHVEQLPDAASLRVLELVAGLGLGVRVRRQRVRERLGVGRGDAAVHRHEREHVQRLRVGRV